MSSSQERTAHSFVERHGLWSDEQYEAAVKADKWIEEYGLEVIFEASPYAEARWISGDKADIEDFMGKYRGQMASDIDSDPVFLAKSSWETGYVGERFPKVRFLKTKERG